MPKGGKIESKPSSVAGRAKVTASATRVTVNKKSKSKGKPLSIELQEEQVTTENHQEESVSHEEVTVKKSGGLFDVFSNLDLSRALYIVDFTNGQHWDIVECISNRCISTPIFINRCRSHFPYDNQLVLLNQDTLNSSILGLLTFSKSTSFIFFGERDSESDEYQVVMPMFLIREYPTFVFLTNNVCSSSHKESSDSMHALSLFLNFNSANAKREEESIKERLATMESRIEVLSTEIHNLKFNL